MKALTEYVQQRNSIRALFGQPPLSLATAQDRQRLAGDIETALEPENLTCDGELAQSQVRRKWHMLTRVRQQLEQVQA